ncbi:uroporphyrinogen-III synthase [Cloeon dipterum]|uniref:uroporphyrinogen-III synthase n=1 Tax=Cloeon dipterum TaxID=197152 RepID=UPI0032209C1A
MESLKGTRVVIFKAETDKTPDPYVDVLGKSGFEAQLVPVITFEFFNLAGLRAKLESHKTYSGLILSSERCVLAVHQSIDNNNESIMEPWKGKVVVCAGEATAKKAKDLLGLSPVLGDKHRGEGIIELLSKMNPVPSCVLYPCGELAAHRDTMASGLAEKNIKCESVSVYKTVPNPGLKRDLKRLFPEDEDNWPKILVFFSPSGFKAVLEHLENCESLNFCRLVSIGPTTTTAIKELRFSVWAEAKTPNPESLISALKNLLSSK